MVEVILVCGRTRCRVQGLLDLSKGATGGSPWFFRALKVSLRALFLVFDIILSNFKGFVAL